MSKLIPIRFAHTCCSGNTVFGQAENGDAYFRKLSWGPDRGWVPVPPPMGIAPEVKRRRGASSSVTTGTVKPARRAKRG